MISRISQTFHRSNTKHHLLATIHTVAISREIPDSFIDAISFHYDQSSSSSTAATAASSSPEEDVVSLIKSREQHTTYLNILRQHVPQLICVPPIESHPDCLFVEDAMVSIQDTVVLTRMGHTSRRGEVDELMRGVLYEELAGKVRNVYDMNNNTVVDDDDQKMIVSNNSSSSGSCCDGGDVLYTGRHLFVGITDRTNQEGFQYLKHVFAHHHNLIDAADVIPVPMMSMPGQDGRSSSSSGGGGVLHLKSAVTHIDEETLLIPEGHFGDVLADAMKVTERGYTTIRLPDVLSCNAVVVNGHVLAQDAPCNVSKRRIEEACRERNLGLTFVDTSELAKKDAALTCCSILLSV